MILCVCGWVCRGDNLSISSSLALDENRKTVLYRSFEFIIYSKQDIVRRQKYNDEYTHIYILAPTVQTRAVRSKQR